MTNTFNGCSYSDLWVSPSNWKTISDKKAMEVQWYIQCDFHDPLHPKPFQYRKKLNKYKDLKVRREAVVFFMKEIPKLFSELGYNPFTKSYMIEPVPEPVDEQKKLSELLPETPFAVAIDLALSKKVLSDRYLKDLKYTLTDFKKGINVLRLCDAPVSDIKRKDIKLILEYLESKKPFSAHKYNKYLDSLNTIYLELVEWEAVDSNIIRDIKKRKLTKNKSEVLTKDQRKEVVAHLNTNFPEFHDFVQIFFHSGIRITELLSVKIKHVDLSNQKYTVLVKKGPAYHWKECVIKDIALPYWAKLVCKGHADDYLFSWGLIPGELQLTYSAIRLRWKRTVQKPLNINIGIYKLKYSNLDEVTELLSLNDAARLANHTTTEMVSNVYAVGEGQRQMERLKKVANEL